MLRRLLNAYHKPPAIRPQKGDYKLDDLRFVAVHSTRRIIGAHDLPESPFFTSPFSKTLDHLAIAFFPSGFAVQLFTKDAPDIDFDFCGSKDCGYPVALSFERCRFDVTTLVVRSTQHIFCVPGPAGTHITAKEHFLHPEGNLASKSPYIKDASSDAAEAILNRIARIRPTCLAYTPSVKLIDGQRPTCYALEHLTALVPTP